jgi:ABC-type multidrug transport system permease subunit
MVYPIGFGQGAAGINGTGFQFIVVLFMELFGVTVGQLIGAIAPSVQVAVLANPFIMVVLTTFCGVTIPFPTMGTWAKSWLYYLDPFTRTLGAMLSTELQYVPPKNLFFVIDLQTQFVFFFLPSGLKITCNTDEYSVFNPPPGQTCGSWAGEFVQGFGGYLANSTATSNCQYCQYSVGDEFFLPLNITYGNRWRDVGILFAFFGNVFNLLYIYIYLDLIVL